MISQHRPWVAALPRLAAIIAIFLSSCTLLPEQSPTPTLIVFPSLTPAPGETPGGELPFASPAATDVGSQGLGSSTPVGGLGAPQETTMPTQTPGPIVHTVAPGESVYSIALMYAVTVKQIQDANNLIDPNLIFVGQQLLVPPSGGQVNCNRDAAFVSDVTVPDNTLVRPGQPFVKTWRYRNTGTCSWNNTYAVIFGAGSKMGTLNYVPLPSTVPGGIAEISVSMTAPAVPGKYTATWHLRDPDGKTFGTDPFITIIVQPMQGSGPGLGPTATPVSMPSIMYPAVSGVTLHARQIWLTGKAMGNRRNVFAKIGDSLSDEQWFLHQIGNGQAIYGEHDYLGPVADFFRKETARSGNSFNNISVATHGGWDSFSPLDPANGTPFDFCGGANPIACELQTIKPSVALIMLGTNEASDHLSSGSYEQNLRQMVQTCLDRGVIPVLYTIPWNKFRDPQPFNAAITQVARSYDIPLVNYWSVVDPLPNHGVSSDGVHPSVPPDQNAANFSAENLQYGYTVRNLVTLQVLDVIWRLELYE